jgi:hypothetical protein
MPGAKGGMEGEPKDETKTAAAEKKLRTRTDAIRAALAKITPKLPEKTTGSPEELMSRLTC